MVLFWGTVLKFLLKAAGGAKTAAGAAAKSTSVSGVAGKLGEKVGGTAGSLIGKAGQTIEGLAGQTNAGAAGGTDFEPSPSGNRSLNFPAIGGPKPPSLAPRLDLQDSTGASSPIPGAHQQEGLYESDLSLEELMRRRLARQVRGF